MAKVPGVAHDAVAAAAAAGAAALAVGCTFTFTLPGAAIVWLAAVGARRAPPAPARGAGVLAPVSGGGSGGRRDDGNKASEGFNAIAGVGVGHGRDGDAGGTFSDG